MAFDLYIVAMAIALAACGVGPRSVDVSGTPGDLRFTVLAPEDADGACANALSVSPVVPEDADPTWEVHSAGLTKCVVEFRYGKVTADIVQDVPATPLRPGVAYQVRASGAGFSVVRDFRLTATSVTVLD